MPRGRKPKDALSASMGPKSHNKPKQPGPMVRGTLANSPPDWLSTAEAEIWLSIVESAPVGLLTALDEPALNRYACTINAYRAIHDRLETLDVASKEAASLRRLLAKESELALRYEAEMALSVTARQRVVIPAPPGDSEFERFMSRQPGSVGPHALAE